MVKHINILVYKSLTEACFCRPVKVIKCMYFLTRKITGALCVSFGGSLSILHTFYQHFYACKTHILPLSPYVYLNVLKKKKKRSHGAGAAEVKQT